MMQMLERISQADKSGASALVDLTRPLGATRPPYTLYAERIAATGGHPIEPSWDGITHFEIRET